MKKYFAACVLLTLACVIGAPLAQAAVGNTRGAATVTPTGAASYSLPIFTPPGTNGMTPSLSLNYSSTGGSGLIGYGWSIGGTSAVYRCPKTWAQDGEARNVRLDLNDRYCLDGNRLRLVNGSHGGGGAEYRTEIETFTRVQSFGAAGAGPEWFKAEMKNGLIYEYGKTSDSRIESLGSATVRAWAVNSIRDRSGNAILFNYTEDTSNGSFRLTNVQYTSNVLQVLSPAYKVEFFYENQPVAEIDTGYLGGGSIRDVDRLTRIDITYNADLVRRYHVLYQPNLSNTSKSRVRAVQECAGPGCAESFAETTFAYQDGSAGVLSEISAGVANLTSRWMMDVNADGRDDMVYSSGSSGSSTWMVMFGTNGGFGAPVNTGITNTNYTQAIQIDYNADGMRDILVPYSGGTWWVLLGSASGLAAPVNTGVSLPASGASSTRVRAMDVNGDGLEDLVWAELFGFGGGDMIRYRARELNGSFSGAITIVGPLGPDSMIVDPVWGYTTNTGNGDPDFNGDGRQDFLYRRVDRVFVDGAPGFWQNSYRSVAVLSETESYSFETVSASSDPTYGDFNGDGCTDLIYIATSTASRMVFGTGSGFSGDVLAPHNPQGLLIAYDWDQDGKDDVLSRNATTGQWSVARSTGLAFETAVSTGIITTDLLSVGDINGDGLQDLAYPTSNGMYSRLHAGVLPDLLTSVTDGFGNVTSFGYGSITQGNYIRNGGALFPEQDFQGPFNVVHTMTLPNGIGGAFSLQYLYYGARIHLQGRGFEGFNIRRVRDSRSGIYTFDYFVQMFPYTGMSRVTSIMQPDEATQILASQGQVAAITYGSGWETRYLPYESSRATTQYEVGGMLNSAAVRTTQTVNQVDVTTGTLYDQTVTTTERTSANGILGGVQYVSRTYYPPAQLTNDTASWCIGRPWEIQSTSSHGDYGGTQITRSTGVAWDAAKCRPTGVTEEPGDSSLQVTRVFGYDGFGNVNSESTTGVGMPTSTTTTNWGDTGQFPVWSDNALSQRVQMSWDYRFGVPSSQTDANGLQTSWLYDAFGRRSRETRSDGTYTTWELGSGNVGCNPRAKYWQWQTLRDKYGAEIAVGLVVADSFDRVINDYQPGFTGFNGVSREYDALGRVAKESIPFAALNCTSYSMPSPTQYQYDLLGRPTQISRPLSDSNPTLQTTTVYYEGLQTRVIDPLSKQTTKIVNALGALVRSTDHSGYSQNFSYDPFGGLVRASDSLSNTLQTNVYNKRGMLTSHTDMDRGSWTSQPNALGQVAWQTDANNVRTDFTYDLLGRLTTTVAPDGTQNITTTLKWGTSALDRNIGQLEWVEITGASIVGNRETYTYDTQGRLTQTRYSGGATDYFVNRSYSDASGVLETLTYPQSTNGYRLKLQYEYQNSHLLRVKDFNAPTTVFWQANAMDAQDHVLDEQLGNGIHTIRGYDQVTGALDFIQSGLNATDRSLQDLTYQWDAVGNLIERKDARTGRAQSLIEHFYYDDLHRLDWTSLNGTATLGLSYDAMGNIASKTGVGTYTYHPTRRHAVTGTSSPARTFTYDNNGNQITRSGASISWYPFNLPKQINDFSGSNTSTFNYNGYGGRWKQVALHSGVTETTTYIGGLMEVVQTTPGVTAYRHYISGGTGTVAEHVRDSSGLNTTRYLTKDHLGSVDSITSSTGSVIVRMSYDIHGERRNELTWSGAVPSTDLTAIAANTRRGFTEHDMLDNLGLVHMNGRVFDRTTGRFISADPFIDGAGNTQGWNRYSYVGNNPLSFVDPSGYAGTAPYYRINPTQDPRRGLGFSVDRTYNFSAADWTNSQIRATAVGDRTPNLYRYIRRNAFDFRQQFVSRVERELGHNADTRGHVGRSSGSYATAGSTVGGISAIDQLSWGGTISESRPLFRDNFPGRVLQGFDFSAGIFAAPFRNGDVRGLFSNQDPSGRQLQDAKMGVVLSTVPLLQYGTRAALSGLGDLTIGEAGTIQNVVNRAGRPLEVVGSAARGARHAGSDIDYVIPPSSIRYFDGLERQLPRLDPSHGIVPGVGNPNIGPVIRFEPAP